MFLFRPHTRYTKCTCASMRPNSFGRTARCVCTPVCCVDVHVLPFTVHRPPSTFRFAVRVSPSVSLVGFAFRLQAGKETTAGTSTCCPSPKAPATTLHPRASPHGEQTSSRTVPRPRARRCTLRLTQAGQAKLGQERTPQLMQKVPGARTAIIVHARIAFKPACKTCRVRALSP